MAEPWSLSGTYYDICSCNVPCPCWWGITKPTKDGTCEFFNAFHIRQGTYAGVDLSGLSVIESGSYTGLVVEGGWTVGVYIDEKAAPRQREALASIFSGNVGGVPEAIKGLVAEVKGIKYVPINYHEMGNAFHWDLGALGEAKGSLVPGGREGKPIRAENTLLGPGMGLTESLSNLRSEIFTYNDREWGWRWDNSGKNVWRAPFAWSNK